MSNFRCGSSVFPTFSGGSVDVIHIKTSSQGARKSLLYQASLSFSFSLRRIFPINRTPWVGYKASGVIQSPGSDLASILMHNLITVGNKCLEHMTKKLTESEDKRFQVGTNNCYRVWHGAIFTSLLHNLCWTINLKLRLILFILSASMDERINMNRTRFKSRKCQCNFVENK